MAIETIKVPNIGGAEDVDVIEISVSVGDSVDAEDTLLVLESDKASMDIPSPVSGTVKKILIKEGDKVSEGAAIFEFETDAAGGGDAAPQEEAKPAESSKAPSSGGTGGSEMPVQIPDIGGAENVDVIEVSVKAGDEVSEGDTICVLESDKASMDIPSPASGVVKSVSLKEGVKVSQGADVLVLEVAGGGDSQPAAETVSAPAGKPAGASTGSSVVDIVVPDLGGAEGVDVIELCVAVGDSIAEGDSVIVLESDKASMDIPAEQSGEVTALTVKEGDKLSKGDKIGEMKVSGGATQASSAADKSTSTPASKPDAAPAASATAAVSAPQAETVTAAPSKNVYAGPAVRKLARQLGVDLSEVGASGPRGRIVKDDVKTFVKKVMTERASGGGVSSGSGIPAIPAVDFAKFGDIETVKMSKIQKVTAANMSRNWLNVPHVTQFDDVDITEMEAFRKAMKADAEKAGVKLTPLPFLLKAVAAALRAEPSFNVSLHHDGEHLVKKNYVHVGMAVDTPNGLMVPVIQDVDKKGLFQLADEAMAFAKKARDGKLMPKDMQGGCFTISSLGAMGGTGFTPIVNAPEVAILGVSRADTKPKWNGKEFEPRLMLPLSLSYDHRAINGGDAGRFFTYLNSFLSDVRRLLL